MDHLSWQLVKTDAAYDNTRMFARILRSVPRLCLLALPLASAWSADLLRYTVRADPFEVEMIRPDGARETKQLPRQSSFFYHRANVRWPLPDGPDSKPVGCEIRWVGFPSDWRLINSFDMDRREQKF